MNIKSARFAKLFPLVILLLIALACPAFSEDIKTLIKKAEAGDLDAQLNLGYAYYDGQGVPQNNHEAVKWFRKAAEQGNAKAQFNLGALYGNGQGVPQDYALAYYWFSLSASKMTGKEDYKRSAEARDKSAMKLTTDQLIKAQQMTRDFEAKHTRN